jgi:hypothetical protein
MFWDAKSHAAGIYHYSSLLCISAKTQVMMTAATTMHHQVEHELWLQELAGLQGEIDIMKRHLSDVYYRDNSKTVMQLVEDFEEKFTLQKRWLEKMKYELENFEELEDQEFLGLGVEKSFSLQMQANRIVNEELKDSFLKLFS